MPPLLTYYVAKDGWIECSPGSSPKLRRRIYEMMGKEDMGDQQPAGGSLLFKIPALAEWIKEHTVDEAYEKLLAIGVPAAQTLRAEAERLKADRVFLMVSGTMNRTTEEVAKMRQALGHRYAGLYQIPPHTPRSSVLDAARAAKAVNADLIVTFGGGSVIDAGKMVRIALRHDITDIDGFEGYRAVVQPDGSSIVPDFDAPTVQQIAIPTTLSGGEFGAAAACNDDRTAMKQNYRHRLLVPRVEGFFSCHTGNRRT